MPLKIILVGASTANLYAGKLLNRLGHKPIIYDKKGDLTNNQMRQLPSRFLKKLGYIEDDSKKEQYVRLTDLKDFLAKDLNIVYNTDVQVDYENEELYIDNNKLDFDIAIIITGHKKIISKNNKIFTYNYSLDNPKKHFPGNSLMTACEKVEKIIEGILNN